MTPPPLPSPLPGKFFAFRYQLKVLSVSLFLFTGQQVQKLPPTRSFLSHSLICIFVTVSSSKGTRNEYTGWRRQRPYNCKQSRHFHELQLLSVFRINRKPLQSDKFRGHISLFLAQPAVKIKDQFPVTKHQMLERKEGRLPKETVRLSLFYSFYCFTRCLSSQHIYH